MEIIVNVNMDEDEVNANEDVDNFNVNNDDDAIDEEKGKVVIPRT